MRTAEQRRRRRRAARAALAVAALAAALGGAAPARAQSLLGPEDGRHQAARLEAGLDLELVLDVGYAYTFAFGAGRPTLIVGAGLRWPPLLVGNAAARVNLAVGTRWLGRGGWGAQATLQPYYVGDSSEAGRFDGLGLELRVAPGIYRRRWFVAVEGGWQGTLATHVRHTAKTRATFADRYPDGAAGIDGPIDGWYAGTAHRFRIGAAAGYAFTRWLTLDLAAGSTFSIQNQGVLVSFDLGQIPMYVQLGVRVAW